MLEVTSQPALIIDNSTNRISWNGRFHLKRFKIFFEIKRNALEQVSWCVYRLARHEYSPSQLKMYLDCPSHMFSYYLGLICIRIMGSYISTRHGYDCWTGFKPASASARRSQTILNTPQSLSWLLPRRPTWSEFLPWPLGSDDFNIFYLSAFVSPNIQQLWSMAELQFSGSRRDLAVEKGGGGGGVQPLCWLCVCVCTGEWMGDDGGGKN